MSVPNELDLEQLAMPKGFYDETALAEIPVMVKKYLNSNRPIIADDAGYSIDMKLINTCIYRANMISDHGTSMARMWKLQAERMHVLLGIDNDIKSCFEWLNAHDKGDPEAVEALLSDSLRTGKWKELPDVLQSVYHERKVIFA